MLLLLAACGSSESEGPGAGGRGGRGGPANVGYVVVQQGSAPLEQELPGRVAAYQVSDVRPQVSGVILKRMFAELPYGDRQVLRPLLEEAGFWNALAFAPGEAERVPPFAMT